MGNKKYYTVRIKWTTKNTTLSEWNGQQKIPHCQNEMDNKKYHTVRIKWTTKNTTLLESNGQQKITHCRNEMDTKNTTLSE